MDMKIKRGQILRQLRLARQLTQNEAAENFGISQQTYQKYESGKTEPPYDLLCDFARFYGVTTDYILGFEPPQPPVDAMEVLGIKKSVDDDEFTRLYNELPDYAKQIFVDTMARLAQATTSNLKKQSTRSVQSIEPSQMPKSPITQAKSQNPLEQVLPPKSNIQISQMRDSEYAIARGGNGMYKPVPTDEQLSMMEEVTPDMLGE